MESKVNYTVVGLFVIVLAAALVGIVAWLTAATDDQVYQQYRVYVNESVAGLAINAPVKYKGVDVGQVMSIRLDRDNPDRVELILKIQEGTPLRENTTAKLVSRGITGIVYVELSGGGDSLPLQLPSEGDLPEIRSEPSLVTQVEDAFNDIYIRLDSLLSEQNRQAFSQTLANLQTISTVVAGHSGNIEQALIHLETVAGTFAESSKRIDKILASTARTLDNSARVSADLKPLVTQMNATFSDAQATIANINRASNAVQAAADASRQELQQVARQTAPELNTLLAELGQLADTLERFVEALERNPRMLLLGKPTSGRGPGE